MIRKHCNPSRRGKAAALSLLLTLTTGTAVFADARFDKWVHGFWPQAKQAGISVSLYNDAFRGLKPDPHVLKLAEKQPEFVTPIWDYVEKRVSKTRIENGQEKLKEWNRWIARIERTYGVDRHIFVSIWGLETAYGAVLQNKKIVRNNIRSLSTLAYGDRRRGKYAKRQLIETLKIVQNGEVALSDMTGSWAGAMGHTQFIPTTYQAYAVDIDGDGRRNVWTSVPDALASAAAYLKASGWEAGKTWGYEVKLPRGFNYSHADSKKKRPLSEWAKLGIKRAGGKAFPRPSDMGRLYLPAGARGPAFVMLKNFDVIKRYNNSNAYALAVGHLADRLRGGGTFATNWSKDYRPLSRKQIKQLQSRLNQRGYKAGTVDGKAGPGTRGAIRAFQRSAGLVPDGQPAVDVLQRLN
ncbi:MAG: lytic murein transglycosylase [Stappiaceae bacterium]